METNQGSNGDWILKAWRSHTVIPAFNIPYLPIMEPVVKALRDARSVGFIAVARLEWEKFQARGMKAIRDEYEHVKDQRYTRLHLDHVPAVDEDDVEVPFEAIITEAIRLGYGSVMIDGSRLPLEQNIAVSKAVVKLAHAAGIAVEAELGAVLGHEAGPLPSYEELFTSGRGFTDPVEARRFAEETGVDWLSVAIGNIHGAITAARKNERKLEARLNIEHLAAISSSTRIPLVLHGGTGIPVPQVVAAVQHGVAKINIATDIRQRYEALAHHSVAAAQQAVYETVLRIVTEDLHIDGTA